MNARCEPVYFGDESKKIILGDALTELKKLPSESVELIFADPPYNIGKDFDGMVESWDEEAFLAWLFECIDECHRILKLKWSTKTGHRVRVFPVSIFRFVWG